VTRTWIQIGASALAGLVVFAGLAAPAAAASSAHYTGTLPDGGKWVADVPSNWNGTLVEFSHGLIANVAVDAPDPFLWADLLKAGYALVGSSYDPTGPLWAMNSALTDQFEALAAVENTALPAPPTSVIELGESMGGLVSALMDQESDGRISGALTVCGLVSGGVAQDNFMLDGSYAIDQLLDPGQEIQIAGYENSQQASAAAAELQQVAEAAQATPQGRARLALASALYNVSTWTATALGNINLNPTIKVPPLPPPPGDYDQWEQEQYNTQYASGDVTLGLVNDNSQSIEQAVGGQPAWDTGVDFTAVLDSSPYEPEVAALYQEAGLSLSADLQTLTQDADISANPTALDNLISTSVPTGQLEVPELTIHNVADEIIPVQEESFYQQLVSSAGDGDLLRQAYVFRPGHCSFTPAEEIAGLQALQYRISTGSWGSAASPSSLNAAARALDEGRAAYVQYTPPALTGANEPTP
jgi:hypothetical protein